MAVGTVGVADTEVSATVVAGELVPITVPEMLPVLMSITHISVPSVVTSFAHVRVIVLTRPTAKEYEPLRVASVKSAASSVPVVARITQYRVVPDATFAVVIVYVTELPSLSDAGVDVIVATGAIEVSATVMTGVLVPITVPVMLPVLMSITH
ncbi:MAG: hypothetical protein EBU49_14965, partial [Proteobacteria bacterium]|nr:hypothetical protein [Pseudomonadota bacterium]